MRELCFTITEVEYQALKRKAFKDFMGVSDDNILSVARKMMVAGLYTDSYITFEEVYEAIEKESVPAPTPGQEKKPKPVVQKKVEKKAPKNGLTPPQKEYNGKQSITWNVWSTIVFAQMQQNTWVSFTTNDVQALIHAHLDVRMDVKVTNAILNNYCLGENPWLSKRPAPNSKKKLNLYAFSHLAQAWLKHPGNQNTLIREGIIDHEVREIGVAIEQMNGAVNGRH